MQQLAHKSSQNEHVLSPTSLLPLSLALLIVKTAVPSLLSLPMAAPRRAFTAYGVLHIFQFT